VSAARRQREGALRAQPNETPLRIEDVEQGIEVARVGPPAVMKDEGTLRFPRRGPNEMLNRVNFHRPTLPTPNSPHHPRPNSPHHPTIVCTFGDLNT
jgi:hypothetical protein